MRTDGSVVTWGPSDRGGDSNDGCSLLLGFRGFRELLGFRGFMGLKGLTGFRAYGV